MTDMRDPKHTLSLLWRLGRKQTSREDICSKNLGDNSFPEPSLPTALLEDETLVSARPKAKPYGLSLLYSPVTAYPSVDLVFIHGLRGDRVETWCHGGLKETFWLQEWLPTQPEFRSARIWTFGYDSDYLSIGPGNVSDLEDFARSLLLEMKLAGHEHPEEYQLPIGKIPLVLVAHSMGGLVVKNACVLGQEDENYCEIVRAICGMVFMATPHGGSEMARSLERILRVLGMIVSPKQYVRELFPSSETLENLNIRFRNFAERLDIFSLYERVPTKIGPFKLGIIVSKPASILGYAKEKPLPIMANHRGICKFPDEKNSRYIAVRGILSSLFKDSGKKAHSSRDPSKRDDLHLVQRSLGVKGAPLDDHVRASECRASSFCQWILEEAHLKSWLQDNSCQPRVVWVHGQSGSGKSVLASFLIDHLKDRKRNCQFFYFRLDQESKRSPSTMLRSIAYQAACQVLGFRTCIASIAQDQVEFSDASSDFLWEKLFIGILFHEMQRCPLYWVIDGLDESTAPSILPTLLASSHLANLPLRVAIFSHPHLSSHFARLKSTIIFDEISLDRISQGLQDFVSHNLEECQAKSEEALVSLVDSLLQSIEGNFLCIRRVLKIIHNRNIKSPLDLHDIPMDIRGLYLQTAHHLSMNWQGNDEFLAKTILTWATCSLRPMSLEEFQKIIMLTHIGKMSIKYLKSTIPRVCGDFVKIEANFQVHIAHNTACQYLTKAGNHPLHIDGQIAQTRIFENCMSALNMLTRSTPSQGQACDSFTMYASVSWHTHLEKIVHLRDNNIFSSLVSFFCGPSAIAWIYQVALDGQISTLPGASSRLMKYLTCHENTMKGMTVNSERYERICDLKQWSIDLRNLASHHGAWLTKMPEAIYDLIPPFCPTRSSIQKYAEKVRRTSLVVEGLKNHQWTNLESRFRITKSDNLREVLCGGRYFITSSTGLDGSLCVFDISTNQKLQEVANGEPILRICLSHTGNSIAVYGYRKTKVWDISRSCYTISVPNPVGYSILGLGFTIDDKVLYACLETGTVQKLCLDQIKLGWEALQGPVERRVDFGFSPRPNCASFNADCSLLAIAYDEGSITVLDTSSSELDRSSAKQPTKSTHSIKILTWDAVSRSLLGIYQNGCVFTWSTHDTEVKYLDDQSTGLVCSPDGRFFVTSHADGKLKVRQHGDFSLLHVFSEKSVAISMAISRCGQKLYDVRGSHCNVWHVIPTHHQTQCQNNEDSILPSGSFQSTQFTFTQSVAHHHLVTALCFSSEAKIHVAGYASGAIRAFSERGKLLTSLEPSHLSINHAIWSEEKSYLATADISTTVHVWSFDHNLNKFNILFQMQMGEKVLQLLFNNESNLLLVAGPVYLSVLSLASGTTLAKVSMSNIKKKWTNHPYREGCLLCFDSKQMQVFGWESLAELETRSFKWLFPPVEDKISPKVRESDFKVKNIWTTADTGTLILHLSLKQPQSGERNAIVAVQSHDAEQRDSNAPLWGHTLMPREQIHNPFGIFENLRQSEKATTPMGSKTEMRLAFLDQDGWVCSVSLAIPEISHSERHFLLPRAWICAENLDISQVLLDGTCLCPKEDEIAVLRNGIKMAKVERKNWD